MCEAISNSEKEKAIDLLAEAIRSLSKSGVKLMILAANTPHIYIEDALKQANFNGEFIDIREAVAKKLEELNVTKVGLLATKSTVESKIYHNYLGTRGIEVIDPNKTSQKLLESVINYLIEGKIPPSINLKIAQIISDLKSKGVEAVVYGCTELSLLIGKVRIPLKIVDSLTEHVIYTVRKTLASEQSSPV